MILREEGGLDVIWLCVAMIILWRGNAKSLPGGRRSNICDLRAARAFNEIFYSLIQFLFFFFFLFCALYTARSSEKFILPGDIILAGVFVFGLPRIDVKVWRSIGMVFSRRTWESCDLLGMCKWT